MILIMGRIESTFEHYGEPTRVAFALASTRFFRFTYYLKVNKKEVKSRLASSLEIPINNTKKSVDSFYLSLYMISGAISRARLWNLHLPLNAPTGL